MNFRNRKVSRRSFVSMSVNGAIWLAGCSGTGSVTGVDKGSEDVIIIGAGPAGMTAAHLLQQEGVNYRVLEAAGVAGGRVKHNLGFADFPVPLGGEWVHTGEEILQEIVNDPSVHVSTELIAYDERAQYGYFDKTRIQIPSATVGCTPNAT